MAAWSYTSFITSVRFGTSIRCRSVTGGVEPQYFVTMTAVSEALPVTITALRVCSGPGSAGLSSLAKLIAAGRA